MSSYPIERVRADFPMLRQEMNGKPLVYLDSAATSLKPQCVIDRLVRFYSEEYGTVRRGAYQLSQHATGLFEGTREQASRFLNTRRSEEVIFVRGVTEAINLVAYGWGRRHLKQGDEILVTQMEHHSNIVPWQLLCEATGAVLKTVPFFDDGTLDMDAFASALSDRTKLVSCVHVSNGLGTINPVKEVCRLAHEAGALAFIDGAQSTGHMVTDVQDIDCDFFACSGHKMLGPTGIGLLYGRHEVLMSMGPFLGGGDMIERVTFEKTTYEDPPYRFEAGTPPFAQVIGLGEAMRYIDELGVEEIHEHEQALLTYGAEQLRQIPGLTLIGDSPLKAGILGFVLEGVHASDIGMVLDQEGIAIRTGQHCVQPVMDRYGIHSTARASLGPYSTKDDIDALVRGLGVVTDLLL
ncbi:MAG: cysteine desulfurase/selenocysteine lyase [Bradymonadia bacterium]|jgi:cysteine desulfurase/selenocysteine lyase